MPFNPSPVARFRKIHYNKMIIVNDYSFTAESGPFSAAPDRRKPQQQPAPIWNGGEGDEHFGATKGYPSDHPAHSLSHRSRQRLPGGRRFAHPGGRRTENGGSLGKPETAAAGSGLLPFRHRTGGADPSPYRPCRPPRLPPGSGGDPHHRPSAKPPLDPAG